MDSESDKPVVDMKTQMEELLKKKKKDFDPRITKQKVSKPKNVGRNLTQAPKRYT